MPRTSSPGCEWVAAGDCYPTKIAACNCICPADKDSVCFSDSPVPGQAAEVDCY